jgi:hypothetical protein
MTTMAMTPPDDIAELLARFLGFSGFGTVYTTVSADDTLVHDETEHVFKRKVNESPVAFIARVKAHAREGDAIAWQFSDEQATIARIIRKDDLPLRLQDGESLEAFIARVKRAKAERLRGA